jgi:signal transduction histidine kinase
MLVGVTGVAGALVLGGLLLYAAMAASLDGTIDAAARASASSVAALVDAGQLPDPVPQSGALVVQVLDSAGRVLSGTVTADRLTPLVRQDERARLADGLTVTVPGNRAALAGDLRVAAVGAGPASRRVLVVAAVPTSDLVTAREALRRLMFVFFPVFLAGLALIAWRVIGAALRPVEDLRRGAERIGEGSSDTERLAVPATHDEVSALAMTLNGMLDRLAVARAKQRAFVADAAHELRSPLASMRTQLDVAAHLGDGRDLPTELLPEVERLCALIEDLLVLARAGDAPAPPAERVDLRTFLAEIADRYAVARVPVVLSPIGPHPRGSGGPGASEPGASEPDGVGEPAAYVNRADLLRSVTNLVDNAVRHAATQVSLVAVATPTAVQVSVTDDGHGIPQADRERVFDRFARLDEARARDEGGSGLGLPIARALVRRSGGDLRLDDADPGLRAVVTLPHRNETEVVGHDRLG